MARRGRYPKDPVAARNRKMLVQNIGITLLVVVVAFMVYLALTST